MTRRVLLVAWDALGWAFALSLAWALHDEFDLSSVARRSLLGVVAVAVAAQLLVGAVLQTYRGRRPIGGVDEALNVTAATFLAGVAVFLVDFALQPRPVPRSVPLLAVPIAVLVAVGSRLAVRLYRERRDRADYSHAHRVIIFGAGVEGQQLLRSMLSDPSGSYRPVALLDDNRLLRRFRMSGVAVRGNRGDVATAAAESRADMLVIADRYLPAEVVEEIAEAADDVGLRVMTLPPLDEMLRPLPRGATVPAPRRPADDGPTGPRRPGPGRAALPLPPPALSRSKRALDLLLCLPSVVVLLPLLMLIAAMLKVSSGEVIYRAPRVGRGGQPFTMFKFVTMIPGDGGPRITRQGDLRITRIGQWLRATKLNELPQIFNVLKGDMSLVGPRPEDPRYTVHYSPDQRRVLTVRPGLTSRAYLQFGDEQAFIERARPSDVEEFYLQELLPEKLDIELEYIDTWSLRQDLRILVGTVKGLLS